FAEAFKVWLRIGLTGFGGPAGQIAMMHRILVDERKWIGEARFLHALNYCMLLPGPEAQQLAIYIGWLMHRIPGGLVAGILFVLPGALVMLGLSVLYAGFHGIGWVQGLFFGLKPAVLAVVIEALLRIGRRALGHPARVGVAGLAFLALFLFNIPFPLVVLAAALIGAAAARAGSPAFQAKANAVGGNGAIDSLLEEGVPLHARPSRRRASRVAATGLALWLLPVLALALLLGPEDTLSRIAIFFSKMAVVTFGGAYAVLSYVAQQAVEVYGWMRPGEMLDGLGLAETTPGPLILVLNFVAFLAGWRHPGALPPVLAGGLATLVALWVTYVPCFLWIFLGGPYVEALRGKRVLAGALAAITAAVVGVILNLAVWFALHVLFAQLGEARFGPLVVPVPDWSSLDPASAILAVVAMLLLLRFHLGMLPTLGASALAGMVWWLRRG
ncbi:MAG: chromate efflux transporter, partial [Rhodospirillales bacterium]|nr:chromate efflux transporter [Rhodospirillales bacterium]